MHLESSSESTEIYSLNTIGHVTNIFYNVWKTEFILNDHNAFTFYLFFILFYLQDYLQMIQLKEIDTYRVANLTSILPQLLDY